MQFTSPRGLGTLIAPSIVPTSYEHYLFSSSKQAFLLDLRRPLGTDSASWLRGPRVSRAIGCCMDPDQPHLYTYQSQLPSEFDLLVYFSGSTPTTLLPYRPPATF
jgi:hypothetical protein